MRLSSKSAKIIKDLTIAVFGDGSTVRLFGSRVDDSKRGGALDIHVEPVVMFRG